MRLARLTNCSYQLSTSVRDLCVKAPSVALYLAQEILNYSRDDSQPEAQDSKEGESDTNHKRSSKRRKQVDGTYRLPKSSGKQPDIARDDTGFEGLSVIGDESVTCQPSHCDITTNQSSDSLMTEESLSSDGIAEVDGE